MDELLIRVTAEQAKMQDGNIALGWSGLPFMPDGLREMKSAPGSSPSPEFENLQIYNITRRIGGVIFP